MTTTPRDHVLASIDEHYGTVGVGVIGSANPVGGNLADVPVERVDRDNSGLLDDTPIHRHAAELEEMNYVGARNASSPSTPIGTEYDHSRDDVVGVRVVGAHVSEFGAIDPEIGTSNETTVSHPTCTWQNLLVNIRRAILANRTFPGADVPTVAYTSLVIENWTDTASDFGDYYRADFDVRFTGFEALP